jgi:hypothetical protein
MAGIPLCHLPFDHLRHIIPKPAEGQRFEVLLIAFEEHGQHDFAEEFMTLQNLVTVGYRRLGMAGQEFLHGTHRLLGVAMVRLKVVARQVRKKPLVLVGFTLEDQASEGTLAFRPVPFARR